MNSEHWTLWCKKFLAPGSPIDGHPFDEVQVGDNSQENVDRFSYLGDMLSAGGGCMAAAIARYGSAWAKFRKHLPMLMNRNLPLKFKGSFFSPNVRYKNLANDL